MSIDVINISDEEVRRLLTTEYENAEIRSGKFNRNPPILKSSNGITGTVLTYSIECGTVFKDLAVLVLEDRIPVEELKEWVRDKVSRHLEEAVGIQMVDEVKVLYCNDPVRSLEDPPPPIIKILVEGIYDEEEKEPELQEQAGPPEENFPKAGFEGFKRPSEAPSSSKRLGKRSRDDQLELERSKLLSPRIIEREGKASRDRSTAPISEVADNNRGPEQFDSTKVTESLRIKELETKIEKLEYLVEMLMRALMGRPLDTNVINTTNNTFHYPQRPIVERSPYMNYVGAGSSDKTYRSEPQPHVLPNKKLSSEVRENEVRKEAEASELVESSPKAGELGGGSDEFIEEFLIENPWAEILSSKKRKVDKR